MYAPKFIFLTETWLHSKIPNGVLKVNNYDIIRKDRKYKKGGGVCVYVHYKVNIEEINLTNKPKHLEALCFKSGSTFYFLLYIAPQLLNFEKSEIISYVIKTCDDHLINFPDDNIIILGDFNKTNTCDLQNQHNLINIIEEPTRKDAILDLCFIKEKNANQYSCDIKEPIGKSDHNVIIITSYQEIPCTKSVKQYVYNLNETHRQDFIKNLSNINWSNLYNEDDIDLKTKYFYHKINEIIKKIPKKVVKMKQNDKVWITPIIKSLINDRWKAYKNKNFYLYDHLKLKIKNKISKSKKEWAEINLAKHKNPWKIFKSDVSENHNDIGKIIDSYENTIDGLNEINTTLCKVFQNNSFVIKKDYKIPSTQLTDDQLFTVAEVQKKLQHINLKKSTSKSDVPKIFYKIGYRQLAEPLTNIFNSSLLSNTIPAMWKISEIVPIPKTKPPKIDNLRPISLNHTPMRIFETLVSENIKYFISDKLLFNQFGFRAKSSTCCALIHLMNYVTSFLENASVEYVSIISYDLSKAFDKVDPQLLLNKLPKYLPNGYIKWFENFLQNRKQKVIYKNLSSNVRNVTSGVPQGSILSPILFNIFIDDLQFEENIKLIKYADDTTIIVPKIKDIRDNTADIEEKFKKWCNKNKLTINLTKTQKLIIYRQRMEKLFDMNHISNKQIKVLGMWIQQNLKWDFHIDFITKKCSSRLYILRKLKQLVPKKFLITLFNGIIMSLIDYCGPVYGDLPISCENKLNSIVIRAHKIICNNNCNNNCLQLPKQRRLDQSIKLFENAYKDPKHSLHNILPKTLKFTKKLCEEYCTTALRKRQFVPFITTEINKL